jgi:hypothetical protein
MSVELFEALMLICFGSAWPFAIAKSLRSRLAGGFRHRRSSTDTWLDSAP